MAEKIESNEPIIFNNEPEEDTFEDWRERMRIDEQVDNGIRNLGWPAECKSEDKYRQLFEQEKQRRSEHWYLPAGDVYEKFFDPQGWAARRPSLEERFEEAMALLNKYPRVGTGKIMLLAQDGHVPAMERAADLFLAGTYLPKRYDLADFWAQKAAQNGSKNVYGIIGFIHTYAVENPDLKFARSLVVAAAESEHPLNTKYAALCYLHGDPMGPNPRLAFSLLQNAMWKGEGDASIRLYNAIRDGQFAFKGIKDPEMLLHDGEVLSWPYAWASMAISDLNDMLDGKIPEDRQEDIMSTAARRLFSAAERQLWLAEVAIRENTPITLADGSVRHLSDYGKTAQQREYTASKMRDSSTCDIGTEENLQNIYKFWETELAQNFEFLMLSHKGDKATDIKSVQEHWLQYKDAVLKAFPSDDTELNRLKILEFLVESTKKQALLFEELLAPASDS